MFVYVYVRGFVYVSVLYILVSLSRSKPLSKCLCVFVCFAGLRQLSVSVSFYKVLLLRPCIYLSVSHHVFVNLYSAF